MNSSNVTQINSDFSEINWDWVNTVEIEQFPEIFNRLVYSVLAKNSKFLTNNSNSTRLNNFQKKRKIISRKISKLNRKILLNKNDNVKVEQYSTKINALLSKKKDSFFSERFRNESKAINNIKRDSKYFFKYTKKHKQSPSSPSLLVDKNNNTITDDKAIADLLQSQFKSVFSSPITTTDYKKYFSGNLPVECPLSDLIVTDEDIVGAINEMKSSSSCPKQNIPARVFKECKFSLCTPLRIFWNKSFEQGVIPQCYKNQIIIPLYKKGPKSEASNFRPISLTPHEIKIIERVIRKKLVEYFEKNAFFKSNQHGFRQMRSCSTQLLSHTYNILSSAIEGNDTDCLYIDFSKAFDKVDHNVLLWKLSQYNVNGKYLTWIRNFLQGRTQTVSVANSFSDFTSVNSGVPQGSVLGPFLFIVSINDLPDALSNCNVLTFADDTKITSEIRSESDVVNLQENLNAVIDWSQDNNMELNRNKFELLCHNLNPENSHQKLLRELPFPCHTFYTASDVLISPSRYVRDLGVLVDCKLNWTDHLNNITLKAKQLCGWILSVFFSRDKYTMLTLFKSLVRSKLEYCSSIWNPYLIKDINKIESIQRSFTHKIKNMQEKKL